MLKNAAFAFIFESESFSTVTTSLLFYIFYGMYYGRRQLLPSILPVLWKDAIALNKQYLYAYMSVFYIQIE